VPPYVYAYSADSLSLLPSHSHRLKGCPRQCDGWHAHPHIPPRALAGLVEDNRKMREHPHHRRHGAPLWERRIGLPLATAARACARPFLSLAPSGPGRGWCPLCRLCRPRSAWGSGPGVTCRQLHPPPPRTGDHGSLASARRASASSPPSAAGGPSRRGDFSH